MSAWYEAYLPSHQSENCRPSSGLPWVFPGGAGSLDGKQADLPVAGRGGVFLDQNGRAGDCRSVVVVVVAFALGWGMLGDEFPALHCKIAVSLAAGDFLHGCRAESFSRSGVL